MLASEAARIFHDWALQQGLMPEGGSATPQSTPQDLAKVSPATEAGIALLRAKQVQAVAFDDAGNRIIVFVRRVAPSSKKALASIPHDIDGVEIVYRQGIQNPVGTSPSTPHAGPTYAVRTVSGQNYFACGSSISVGNFRDAGTLGCLVRDSSGHLHGLTNNHVSASCNFAGVGLPILAPGVYDVLPNSLAPFTIGYHVAALPMVAGSADNVNAKDNLDAAIFRIAKNARVSSFQGSAYDTPVDVGNLLPGMNVEKVGRTTQHTSGTVMGQIFGVHSINYSAALYGFSGVISFEPVFAINGVGTAFSDAGDSGSLITTVDAAGKRSAVGIVTGGMNDGSAPGGKVTIALPLAPILAALNVTLVSGENV